MMACSVFEGLLETIEKQVHAGLEEARGRYLFDIEKKDAEIAALKAENKNLEDAMVLLTMKKEVSGDLR